MDLRQVIREVLDSTNLAEPSDVAEEAFARLTRGQHAEALRQSLREVARVVITQQRRHALPTSGGDGGGGRSWKREGIQELNLNARFHVGGAHKLLRDMTRDDLLYAVKERRENAARNLAIADQLERLADELAPGQTVGDLMHGRTAA